LRHVVSPTTIAVDENLPAAGTALAPLVVLDSDGDCADDLVVASTGGLDVWPSDDLGQLAPAAARVTGGGAARAIAVGDLDEDGLPDLLTVNDSGSSVLRADGVGGFQAIGGALNDPLPGASAAALGDLDGDGHLDAFVGIAGSAPKWLRGDGHGKLTLVAGAFTTAYDATGVVLRDLDEDGDLDALLATRDGNPGLRLFVNGGRGGFTDASAGGVPALVGTGLVGVATGDLDGDCRDELVLLGPGAPLVLSVNDLGQFQSKGMVGTTPATSATIGDLDGDGVQELVLIGGRQLSIWSTVGGGAL
jgi:hypothetical protein